MTMNAETPLPRAACSPTRSPSSPARDGALDPPPRTSSPARARP
ncbi:hypothetical protein ACN28S_00520 [Cystobacter fuscus]